jgi:murein DD-endopeptidase MepM/ murein hydrolase activator NlpD
MSRSFLGLFLMVILAACQPQMQAITNDGGPGALAQTSTVESPQPINTTNPATAIPRASITPYWTATATPLPKQTSTPQASATPSFVLCSPLGMHPLAELPQIISDPYHPPPMGKDDRHQGVDFSYWHYGSRDSMLGEPVQAILSGVVAAALNDSFPYGNMVMIETRQRNLPADLATSLGIKADESLYIVYAHLDQPPAIQLGDAVNACQALGEVGESGNTDIPHLHVETRKGLAGTVFAGMRYYQTRATQVELDNYRLWRMSGVFQHFDPMRLLTFTVP